MGFHRFVHSFAGMIDGAFDVKIAFRNDSRDIIRMPAILFVFSIQVNAYCFWATLNSGNVYE